MRRNVVMSFWTAVITTTFFGLGTLAQAQTRASAALSAGARPSNGQQALRSVVIGSLRPKPIYVDTGPFAAAEAHAYWTPSGPQLAVVGNDLGYTLNHVTNCPTSRVRLEMRGGSEYPLRHPDRPAGGRKDPEEVRRARWVFVVRPGEKPACLVIARPQPDIGCPGLGASPWPALGSDRVLIPLNGLASRNDIGNFAQGSPAVRLGQLEIRMTSVGLASKQWMPSIGPPSAQFGGVYPQDVERGHHVVQVSLAIKNVTEYPDCTELNDSSARLLDNRGFEYGTADLISVLPGLVGDLVPGEGIGANITFEVWDGASPHELLFRRSPGALRSEGRCAQKQHRLVDMHGGSEVRIPITGVPAVSLPAQR